jgi:hypothetical protein
MIKRYYRSVAGLFLLTAALLCFGCAGKDSYMGFKLGQPEDVWCQGAMSSPFPPYCRSEP